MTKKTKNEFNELVRDDSKYGDKPRKKHGLSPYKRVRSKVTANYIEDDDYDEEDDASMHLRTPQGG